MTHLTPTQQKIIEHLPATPDQLAQALYGRATESERNLIYVHIALLRRRLSACPLSAVPAQAGAQAGLSARCPSGTPQAARDGTAHIVSNPLPPFQRSSNAEENACPERRPEPVEGPSRRDGLETDGYTSRIIYELQTEGA